MIDTNRLTKEIRCAIYTRKSTTEGLEQEFNSLDAQRESCSSYIASQRHEGWVEIDTRARVTQIINLTNLAPDIQQAILDLKPTTDPAPRFRERKVRSLAILPNWDMQRVLWKRLVKPTANSKSSE